MFFQRIHERALAEPAIGYAASSKFTQAPFDCPKCKGIVWQRHPKNSNRPLGFVCPKCGWLSTYTYDPNPKPVRVQGDLFLDPPEPSKERAR